MKPLQIGGRLFRSRLFIGTGKFGSHDVMRQAIEASGAELVTVALRRVDLDKNPAGDPLLSRLDPEKVLIVPNTSGARTAEEAVRIARLARAAGGYDWVKLELTPNLHHLLPDPIETLKAAEILVKEGFRVLPYINADPVLAKRLEEAGTVAVMPLAAPIGTNLGLRTRDMIEIIVAHARVPVVVDAGLGLPSHAAAAIELGADCVLVNTAIATAADPVAMAQAFALAVRAAETGLDAGPRAARPGAEASSPLTGFLWQDPGKASDGAR
ncbi:MAG: thiazole synthase [Kiritimatiellia bacterium]|jgi:thiazole synthase|nr:thiazole synthase [Kiritimatiellia bacterium]